MLVLSSVPYSRVNIGILVIIRSRIISYIIEQRLVLSYVPYRRANIGVVVIIRSKILSCILEQVTLLNKC